MPTISPSIHEAVIARYFVRDADGDAVPDPALAALHDAMQQARAAAERAGDAADTVLRNGSTPIAARQRSARDAAWSGAEPALRALEAAATRAQAERARLEAAMRGPAATSAAAAATTRSRMAGMTPAERAAALRDALEREDDAILGAVLAAPPARSGIASQAEHDMLRHRWRRARHADAIDRAERLGRSIGDAERASSALIAHIRALCEEGSLVRAAGARAAAI